MERKRKSYMTAAEFRGRLRRLGIKTRTQASAAFAISESMIHYYAKGEKPIPKKVALLLQRSSKESVVPYIRAHPVPQSNHGPEITWLKEE